jgi:hypothetical protein
MAELRVDILCTNKTSGNITRAFTLVSNNMDFTGKITLTSGFVVHLENLNFNFSVARVDDSVIGDFNLWLLNALIGLFKGAIIGIVGLFFKDFHLGFLLKWLNLDVIDLDKAALTPHD